MLGWTLLALVLLILAILAGAFGLLQTGWGKREIASLASGALSGEGKTAEITGIEGLLPFEVRVARVRLGDSEGHWLEVDGARFHLVPSALLRLKVEIATVGAERVALNRLPPSAPTPEPPEPFTFPSLPEVPKSLPVAVGVPNLKPVFIDKISPAEHLDLGGLKCWATERHRMGTLFVSNMSSSRCLGIRKGLKEGRVEARPFGESW